MYRAKRRRLYARNPINHLAVFEFHNWICAICGNMIDSSLRFPNPQAATLEHVIPLSRGGMHHWDNVRPAHATCNFSKGNLVPEEYDSRFGDCGAMDYTGNGNGKNRYS